MIENEWLTRKKRIDAKLRSAGWTIAPYREGMDLSVLGQHAIEELPTESGPADYALVVAGQLVGIVEAKKVTVNPQNVLEQAKRYARTTSNGIGNWGEFKVPFLYASNGEVIWHADVRTPNYTARTLSTFHSPAALRERLTRKLDRAFDWLRSNPPGQIERLRPYQRDAISAIETELQKGRRKMLIAMATGTGKTFFTVAQIYRLLRSGAAKRILFLVDRKALAAQAVREFNSFQTPAGNKFTGEYEVYSQKFRREDFGEDEPFDPTVLPESYLIDPQGGQTFVYVSTIQRMTINLFGYEKAYSQSKDDPDYEDDAQTLDIPIHAFDLIIADECHRGYTSNETNVWRETLNHFDAVKIGLTATPAMHTTSYFGKPVFRYGVEQAIRDGFLVDYEAVAINSDVKLNGVFLNEGESVSRIDTNTGEEIFDELEDERTYQSTQIEADITVVDSNRKVIEELAKYAYDHEEKTGRFPKTLIFAVNDVQHTSHADQLVRICREVFGQGDDFVQKITGNPNVDRPLQKIREFRNRPNPTIVVTVDMLSTGVDIPALEFIVFLRPVKSRILWEQMLGRGTRLCRDINKDHFRVFDCFGGSLIEYFKDVSNFKIEPPTKPPTPLPQVIENIYQNVDRQYHTGLLQKRLRRIENNMSGPAREEFAKFIPDGDIGKFAETLRSRIEKDFTATLALLRDPEFQDLLENYERADRIFLVSYEDHDTVTSAAIDRFGKFDKPEYYIEAFAGFVRENEAEIDALSILLNRPEGWEPKALAELSQKLKQSDFDTRTLQQAHFRVYHKELADIISMVKRAADERAALLSATERVDAAMQRIREGKSFDAEQEDWLGYIRQYLIDKLSIDEEDIEYQPLFVDRGGLGKAKKVFGDGFTPLIREINSQIASLY